MMEIDLRTLEMFHRMAREGAKTAASRLTTMTELDTDVRVTRVQFATPDELSAQIQDDEYLGVNVNVSDGINGDSVVVFNRSSAQDLTDTVVNRFDPFLEDIDSHSGSEDGEISQEVLSEIGHMMNCGFVDGWADVIGIGIDVSPPSVGVGSDMGSVFGDVTPFQSTDLAIVFQSVIEINDTELSFRHYLFPEVSDLGSLLRSDREVENGFEYEKLAGFDQMVDKGSQLAAKNMSDLTGVDTEVRIRNLNFVPVPKITEGLSNNDVVGVAFTYQGLPSGYLLFVFDEPSAVEIVNELVPDSGGGTDPLESLGKSALKELGNIMASGVLDGWARVLGTVVNHSPPKFVKNGEEKIMRSITSEVHKKQEYAFMFDTVIEAEGTGSFSCKIYSICEEGDLEEALARLDIEDVENADLDERASFPVDSNDEELF